MWHTRYIFSLKHRGSTVKLPGTISLTLSLVHDRNPCLGTWKALMLSGSSKTSAAPTAVPRSINSRVSRNSRDHAVPSLLQLSTFIVLVRPVVTGADWKSLGSCVLIHDDLCASYCTLTFRDAGWALGIGRHSPVLTLDRTYYENKMLWDTRKAITGRGFLSTKDHASTPRP
jgi:hypothetical protein